MAGIFDYIIPGLSLFSALGASGANAAAGQASEAAAEATKQATQEQKDLYDFFKANVQPQYAQTVIPGMLARAKNPPPYAGQELALAKQFSRPLHLDY